VIKRKRKSEKLERIKREGSISAEHANSDIFHTPPFILTSKPSTKDKRLKERFEEKAVNPKKEEDLKW
jgi:hypothetical protein